CLITHSRHTLLHGFQVTDKFKERLNFCIQLGELLFGGSVDSGCVLLLEGTKRFVLYTLH
ncbi:hypothetical protein GOODEAATRI_018229, partial [Goodea atripinnis]